MKYTLQKVFALVLVLILLAFNLFLILTYLRTGVGYTPIQSVSFSHKVHSRYNISCLFCHHQVEINSYANYPTTRTCMTCHIALKTESEFLKNVVYSYDSLISLNWNKVYDLPDYVRFSHSHHIRSGIDCATCHGNVEEMDSVYRVRPLTMGWCVECHKNPSAYAISPREISGIFYIPQDSLDSSFPSHKVLEYNLRLIIPISKPLQPASIECSSCHN
ncbi:MAG: cytochrome c family protein [Ignavibacteria bacterium]|nr:cytochrome c family protein [Ignavibacteria bacterium]